MWKKNRNFDAMWETWYPFLISVLLLPAVQLTHFNTQINNVDKIVDASINVASILIGLLGALLGILISIQNSSMVQYVFSTVHRHTIYRYIKQAIFAGICTIGFASSLYVFLGDKQPVNWLSQSILYIWLFSSFFLLLSAYRIIDILMYLLANKDVQLERPRGMELSQQEVEDLKKQNSRGKKK